MHRLKKIIKCVPIYDAFNRLGLKLTEKRQIIIIKMIKLNINLKWFGGQVSLLS